RDVSLPGGGMGGRDRGSGEPRRARRRRRGLRRGRRGCLPLDRGARGDARRPSPREGAVMQTPYLKPLLGRGRPIWVMGAHDVLSAKIVERAGFAPVGGPSLQLAMVNGVPDIGIVGPDELVRICRKIRRAVSLPIVVDFEQGFGEPYVAVHWMKELEAAGVAAVHIDDYGLPYKCPF